MSNIIVICGDNYHAKTVINSNHGDLLFKKNVQQNSCLTVYQDELCSKNIEIDMKDFTCTKVAALLVMFFVSFYCFIYSVFSNILFCLFCLLLFLSNLKHLVNFLYYFLNLLFYKHNFISFFISLTICLFVYLFLFSVVHLFLLFIITKLLYSTRNCQECFF